MKSRFPIVGLGKYVRQISQRNRAEGDIEVFSVTNSEGFTRSTDYFSKEVFSKDVSNYKVVSPGQFAYNPSRINVGSIDYLRHGSSVLVSPLYIVFEGKKDLHADYLLRYLKSDWGNAQIRANTEGAVRDSLKFKGLENIKLPLPILDDQLRIAHLLGKVEGLIIKRKQHLQQLDDLLKSVFLEMFGDPARNEKGWDTFPIEQIVENTRNGLSPTKGGGLDGFVYTLSALTGEEFREIFKKDTFSKLGKSYIPSHNDFLVCRGNGNINLVGRGYFYPGLREDIMFPDTVIALTIKGGAINSQFLEALWQTKFIRDQIEKSARTANGTFKINQTSLCQIDIISPPPEKQHDFEKVAAKLKKLRTQYKRNLVDLEALYGALSQQAFKGELDLSRVPLPTIPSEGEHIVASDPLPAQNAAPAINLPDSDLLLPALENREHLRPLLLQWLDAYRAQLGHEVFSVECFMAAAQTRLAELHRDGDFELGTDDYDQVKDWVFESLAAGTLTQAIDDEHNRVTLKSRPADWGSW